MSEFLNPHESGKIEGGAMKAHKTVEALDDMRGNGLIDPEIVDLLISKIVESQKFEFSFGDFPVFDAQEMQDHLRDVHMPYKLCYFEIPTVGAILAREHNDAVMIQPFLGINGKVGTFPPEAMILIDKRDGSICCHSKDQVILDEWEMPKPGGEIAIVIALICLIIRGLSVLNCTNVVCVNNPPAAALNKKRMRSGKSPIYSYKTLHIKTQESTGKSVSSICSPDRYGPRLHLRRGHIRRLPSGARTWVQSCMVGNMDHGMAMKEYRVT